MQRFLPNPLHPSPSHPHQQGPTSIYVFSNSTLRKPKVPSSMASAPESDTTQIAAVSNKPKAEGPREEPPRDTTEERPAEAENKDEEPKSVDELEEEPTKKENDTPNKKDDELNPKDEEEGKEKRPKPSEDEQKADTTTSKAVAKSSSFKEESNFLSDLKENEKKALLELRSMLEEAILEDKLLKKSDDAKHTNEEVKDKENNKEEEEEEDKHKEKEKDKGKDTEKEEDKKKENEEDKKEEEQEEAMEEDDNEQSSVDQEISLWGVPLLPSRNSECTDVVLLKFLCAREFKAKEALEMLMRTLQWRKEMRMDEVLSEEGLGEGLEGAAYMDSARDQEGHPICYNVLGMLQGEGVYEQAFGTEERVERFLRWRFQLMEKGIKENLDLRPGGPTTILHVTDLKNAPGVSRKELRAALRKAVALLQDNYPEFVAKNVFINVPFWYYAFNALLSPFLTQRTKSKFVFARPSKVTETLLRYIPAEEIPPQYGGLRRENDLEFSPKDGGVSQVVVKAGTTENIELPTPEVGLTLVWDLTVLGWEVSYKEEFVPDDEGSYTIIVQKARKMAAQEEAVRNSFRNNEPGKVVLTVENNTFKKKRVLYRYKTKSP